jgi:hypothetical protein
LQLDILALHEQIVRAIHVFSTPPGNVDVAVEVSEDEIEVRVEQGTIQRCVSELVGILETDVETVNLLGVAQQLLEDVGFVDTRSERVDAGGEQKQEQEQEQEQARLPAVCYINVIYCVFYQFSAFNAAPSIH